jgi:[glutamine synthetase] adenylyltransferase / [glutamine synthetase]-adenylyl-L-tyrosine phosphorylase
MVTALERPSVVEAVERSADPAAARVALARLVERHPGLDDELAHSPFLVDAVVAVVVASRSLLAGLLVDRGMLDAIGTRAQAEVELDVAAFGRRLDDALTTGDDPAATLRRWKRRELLRIAARDLLGIADLASVGRELAAVAEAALRAAVRVAAPSIPFAVIGMGKLGGCELNYASDVDVLFVHEGDAAAADHVAREVLALMAHPTEDGIVFRTDADLRPEGRAGPLSRSLDAYMAYYERWAQNWEFQALVKARPVAGDDDLGARFAEATAPFVWPEVLNPDAIREIRTMKARSESENRRRGGGDRELKRGPGGIRDIEFAIQLLQLVHGRHDRSIRSRNTLEALGQLAYAGYVEEDDARRLARAYRSLRTVEHRLQLWDEQQTHTLPSDVATRTRLARVLGYRDRPDAYALEQFDANHRAQQAIVRSIHEKLFFAPLLEALAGTGPLPLEAAEERLIAFGFTDVTQARAALRELTRGLTRRSQLMQQLLPLLLEWCSVAPDPDLALLQLRRLVEGPVRSAALATAFRDVPGTAERTCRVLGSSRLLGDALRRHPELVDLLGSDAQLAVEKTRAQLVEEGLRTLTWRRDDEERGEGLRRFKRRELLRIGARDLLGFADTDAAGRELAALADASVEAALHALAPPLPFAVIGMGRLGGLDLSYASDIDVLFVYEGDGPDDFAEAERIAEALMTEIGATTAEGQTFRIDAQLRPEGKQGPLARSLGAYRQYYERWALTWEFQALLKARPVAGDLDLAGRFCDMIEPLVYRDPFPEDAVREVRRMKARIERERIPPGEDPQFHLKLGRGSLSDVEFTAQLLQLEHGGELPALRTTSTVGALRAAAAVGVLDPEDAHALETSHDFCSRARNYRYLLTNSAREALPTDSTEALRLGRMLGYVHRPQAGLRDDYRRITRRARRVVERVFYGREPDAT